MPTLMPRPGSPNETSRSIVVSTYFLPAVVMGQPRRNAKGGETKKRPAGLPQ